MQITNPSRLNGCHNRPLLDNRVTYFVQDGYHESMQNGQRVRGAPRWKLQEGFTKSSGCVYDKKATDSACTGCYLIALNPDGSVNADVQMAATGGLLGTVRAMFSLVTDEPNVRRMPT